MKALAPTTSIIRRITKKDYIYIAALTGALALLVLIFTQGGRFLFGSTTDWECQHITLPEYFRNLFYDTKQLFPSFAANLGAGQNIFYFAYYGLLSPYILFSYLLPWVKMTDFIIGASIFCVWLSVVLFYIYRRCNGDREENALLLSALFLFSAPLIFHSHRHVMFILYFPFLIGAYFGVERYLKHKKFGLLVICSVLIIFTSYYYSPTALISIFILALYRHLHINRSDKFNIKKFTLFALKIAGFLALAVAVAAILLLPTAYVILHSRGSGTPGGAFRLEYFLPEIRIPNLLYSPYSLGMCSIAIFAIISNFFSKRRELIFLSSFFAFMLFFPAVNYITNGMLYFNGKTYIPFIPLCLIMLGGFFRSFFSDFKLNKAALVIYAIGFISAAFSSTYHNDRFSKMIFALAIDTALTLVFLILTSHYKRRRFILSFLIIFSMTVCCVVNFSFEKLVERKNYETYKSDDIARLEEIVSEKNDAMFRTSDTLGNLYRVNYIPSVGLYKNTMYSSTFNKAYNKFYYKTLNNEISYRNASITNPTHSILSNIILANKYIIAKEQPCAGYRETERLGDYAIYENDSVLPFAYLSDKFISEAAFAKLEYPYNVEALTKYLVTGDGTDKCKLSTQKGKLDIKSTDYPDTLSYTGSLDTGLTLSVKENTDAKIVINNSYDTVFLRIKLDPEQNEWFGDRTITINGITNKLTERDAVYHNKNFVFDYVISSDSPVSELNVNITEGDYKIKGIEIFYLNYADISSAASEVTPLNIDTEKTRGDAIVGTINAGKDGKLLFTLPYDTGYSFKVDGQSVKYHKANSAFIAIDISKGEHTVEVKFTAPWLNAGKAVSGAALLTFAALMVLSAVRRKKALRLSL